MTDKLTLGHVGFGPLWNGPRNPDGSVPPIGTGGAGINDMAALHRLATADPRDAEIARLRAALLRIDTLRAASGKTDAEMLFEMRSIAKAALDHPR